MPLILYKTPALITALAILYLAIVPLPEPPVQVPLSDKISHMAAFLVLGILAALPFRRTQRRFFWTILLPLLYGAGIEFIQSFLPNRQPELLDFVADAIGAIFAHLIVVLIAKNKYN